MGLENLSKYAIILKSNEEGFIIKTCDIDEDVPDTIYKLQLPSLFTFLEDNRITQIQPDVTKITTLDLSYCDLSELPKYVNIFHLKIFNISHNKFTQVPSCLFGNGLNVLRSLDMSYNVISQFDIEPDCVLNLKQLKINNNCFEHVPKWFLTFRCTNLEDFNYSDNKATHYKFLQNSFNFKFMKLKKLELRNSCLVNKDITWIKGFKNLNYLDISNKTLINNTKYINKFKELDGLFVKPSWNSLEVLKLNFLDISFFPQGIFWVESLKELYINNNLLSWFPDGLEYLVNLEILDISNNQLVFIPKQISELARLRYLFSSGNHLEEIPAMPGNLELLDLYDNYLILVDSENLQNVKFIDLEFNYINLEENRQRICYQKYCSKRDLLRNLYNIKDRISGVKLKEIIESLPASEKFSDESDCELYNEENKAYDQATHEERIETLDEDWDREIVKKPVFKHPDISLSDHEYDGEKELFSPQNIYKISKTYMDDEDIMFVDAD